MSISGPKKSRGRPPVESDLVKTRIAQPLLGKLDEWINRQEPKPTRQEAVRTLLAERLFQTRSQRRIALRDGDEQNGSD
jgi:hypothetical protein